MNIVVCVKQMPDTAAERTLKPGDGTLDCESPNGLINELDEYAIEEGLKLAETHDGEVTILSSGAITVHSGVRSGTPIVAMRPNVVAAEPASGAAALNAARG